MNNEYKLIEKSQKHKDALMQNSRFPIMTDCEKDTVHKHETRLDELNMRIKNATVCQDVLKVLLGHYDQYHEILKELITELTSFGDNVIEISGCFNSCPAEEACHIFTPLILKIVNYHAMTWYQGVRLFSDPANVCHYRNNEFVFKQIEADDYGLIDYKGVSIGHSGSNLDEFVSYKTYFEFTSTSNEFTNENTEHSSCKGNSSKGSCGCNDKIIECLYNWKLHNPDNGYLDLDLTVPQYFNPLKLCEDMLSPPDGKETNDVIVDFLTDLMNILNKSYANKITIDGNMIAINNVIERSQYEMKVIQNKLESMLFLDSELSTSHIHKNEEIRHQLKSLPATRKISPLSSYF